MPKKHLDYYQENLEYLRDLGVNFAREFPKIASRLELSENECGDPYVERLLEGSAFLAAKVEYMLDRSMPHMLESVLGSVLPFALDLIPSCAVAELKGGDLSQSPDPSLPACTVFEASVEGSGVPCTFVTMVRSTPLPVTLLEARYLTLDLQKYDLSAEAGLYLKIRKNADFQFREENDDLLIYLDLSGAMASRLQQHLQMELTGSYVISEGKKRSADGVRFSIPMLDKDPQAADAEAVTGRHVFHAFVTFQAGFRFVRFHGAASLLRSVEEGKELELIFTFRKRCSEFLQYIDEQSLRLNCVPLCNLFRKKSDRMPMAVQCQHHLVPDRTNPIPYEVSRVLSVSLFDSGNQKLLDLRPLYDTGYTSDEDSFNFFTVLRYPRLRGDTEKQHSSYVGQEVFLAFSGEQYQHVQQNAIQFSAEMLCTNRDLPLFLRTGAVLKARDQAFYPSAVLISSPTVPGTPVLNGSGTEYAEKAACLMVRFSDMFWSEGVIPAGLLRKIIHVNIPVHQEDLAGLERSIVHMETTREMFRYVLDGQVFYESGWKIRLVLDELACTGIGCYIFGCVLREFLRSYKPVNVPCRIVLETKQQEGIAEWMI